MSKPRKKPNMRAVRERSMRALLKTNYVCVACVGHNDNQAMIHWKHCAQIRDEHVAYALCNVPHRWTVYISVFCERQDGELYSKSIQFHTENMHMVASLNSTIEAQHDALVAGANPLHVIGTGWLAAPDIIDLTEAQANKVFEAMGAWKHKKAA